ncbi:MAG: peptide-methionine (R)-S-oxide reductase MsrB [Akkermansiaceae bacterium]
MLDWKKILEICEEGNLKPEKVFHKSEEEWRALLTPEQFQVMRQHGTERPFSSEMCGVFEPGRYACACCGNPLFDGAEKFESGTGWPSFTQPIRDNAISYHMDTSLGMVRVETRCNNCGAHLGHVFPDGPGPGGLRYCMNAVALNKMEDEQALATFGGGCYWCTEAMFQRLRGVKSVVSGFSDGEIEDPSYEAVCSGSTGHAEVIQVSYDPAVISFKELIRVHMGTHDPTTLNAQGADVGTQYRSIILFRNDEEKMVAERVLQEMDGVFDDPIVTEVKSFRAFYPAPEKHFNYYNDNPYQGYCQAVISPKVAKFRKTFAHLLDANE